MFQDHWKVWLCPFGCACEYSSSSGLEDHLHEIHMLDVVRQDVESIVNLSSTTNSSRAEGPCPLCYDVQIKSGHQYQSHVGHHLEQLALFVLPTQYDEDDEEEDDYEHRRDESGSSQDSGFDTEFEEIEHMYQLARNQEYWRDHRSTEYDIEQRVKAALQYQEDMLGPDTTLTVDDVRRTTSFPSRSSSMEGESGDERSTVTENSNNNDDIAIFVEGEEYRLPPVGHR